MTELTHDENLILDMLGADLKAAILGARDRTKDQTIAAHISAGVVIVSRGGIEGKPQAEDAAIVELNAL